MVTNKLIPVIVFKKGSICEYDFKLDDVVVELNVNFISEVSSVEKFNKHEYFTITMNNGNTYHSRPENRSRLILY